MNSLLDVPDLVGTAEAAQILGVSRGSVNLYVKKGSLTPVCRIGKRGTFAFDVKDIQKLQKDRAK